MTATMNEAVAHEVIRSRTTHHEHYQRPRYTRTSRVLRGLARRLDGHS
jgi:hypothetical protein